MPDWNMTPAIICLIFSSYFASVHPRIKPPDFNSGWLPIEAADRVNESLARKNISHGLGETPLLVDVQVKAIDGPNKGYIFKATGHQIRHDDYPQAYGNVVYVYNNESVIVSAPVRNDGYQVGKAIFIASATFWVGPNQDYSSNSALFRVRAWKESSLPPAGFVSKSNVLTAATDNSSYLELFHGLDDYPILVICRIRFPTNDMNYAYFYADSVGAGMIVYATNESQNAGYVVYGYNSQSIRVWAPSLKSPFPGTLFDGTDGSGISVAVTSATLELFAWADRSFITQIFDTYASILQKTWISENANVQEDTLIRVEASPSDGANKYFVFQGSGSLAYSEHAVANLCSYGGLMYAYNNESIRFWSPRSPHGSIICIQDVFGNGTNSQASSNVTLYVSLWETGCGLPIIAFGNATLDVLFNYEYGATAHVTCEFGFKPTRTSITCLSTGDWETAYCVATDLISLLCGLNWIYSVKENFCYQIVIEQTKTWQASREYCQQKGGDLLSISGVTEQNFIQAALSNGQYANLTNIYWIGATDKDKESDWKWTDNTAFEYVNWFESEPDNFKGIEDCAEIRSGPYWLWNDNNCGREQNFICKKKYCGGVPYISHGNVTLKSSLNTTDGAEATVSCDVGYTTTLPVVKCRANGNWDVPTCNIKETETGKNLPIVAIAAGAGGGGAAILVIIIVVVVCVCRKRSSSKASNGNRSSERCDIQDDGYTALAASGIRSPDPPPRKPEQIEEEDYHYLDESAMVDMSKLMVDMFPIPPDRKDNPSGNDNYNDGYLTASNTLTTDPRPDYPMKDEYSNNTSDGYLVASSVGSRESGSGITNPAFRQINNGFL